jgi:hypothetical protein
MNADYDYENNYDTTNDEYSKEQLIKFSSYYNTHTTKYNNNNHNECENVIEEENECEELLNVNIYT